MYAIIETGGKQYRVAPGEVVQLEKLAGEVGQKVELDKVRFVNADGQIHVGQPLVEGARVAGEVVKQSRTRSITVFKKKRRKNYRRTKGHRQSFTQVRITSINTAK